MREEDKEQLLLAKIGRGETITSVSEIPEELKELLIKTVIIQWNCEQHGGMNYLNCLRLGIVPEKSQKVVLHIGREELGHAAYLEAGPLRFFGVNPWDQFKTSVKEQKDILTIFQYPEQFDTWARFLMFNHLQDRSAAIQLAELKNGPLKIYSDAIRKIESEEVGHIAHGEKGIREWAKTAKGLEELQLALDGWLPLALQVFGAPDHQSKSLVIYRKYGFKQSNDALRELYRIEIKPLLDEVGLSHPLLIG